MLAIGLALLVLTADFFTGPYVDFQLLYLLPVSFAAWYDKRRTALAMAVVLPLVRMTWSLLVWIVPWAPVHSVANACTRIVVCVVFAILVARLARQQQALQREVRILSGILPICSFCKRIRNTRGEWRQMEEYISRHSEAEFTHGICPHCAKIHYGEVLDGGAEEGRRS